MTEDRPGPEPSASRGPVRGPSTSRSAGVPGCLIVQHVAAEPPTGIAEALEGAGIAVERRRVFTGASVPTKAGDFQGVVVMGGPMSARRDEGFPTRRAEVALLADALSRGLPTLGICLGAQLLALAGGGAVRPGEQGPEIGWGPVSLTGAAQEDPLLRGLPGNLTVLHWHGDTFELPPGAVHLAASSRYAHQAFRLGRAWGLQFHLEVDAAAVGTFLEAFPGELTAAGTTPEQLRAATPGALAGLAASREQVLGRFAALVTSPGGSVP